MCGLILDWIKNLGGVDAIVFTGGIGEHVPIIRKWVAEDLDYCGAVLDQKKNLGKTKNYLWSF